MKKYMRVRRIPTAIDLSLKIRPQGFEEKAAIVQPREADLVTSQ